MDTVTHIMIAYCVYIIVALFYRSANKFVIPLIIGSALPDLDYFFNIINCEKAFLRHRGAMHSFVGILPVILITALILSIPKMKKILSIEINYLLIVVSMYVGFLIHILTDTTAKMLLLFPFSMEMVGNINPIEITKLYYISLILIVTTLLLCNRKIDYELSNAQIILKMIVISIVFGATFYWIVTTQINETRRIMLLTSTLNFLYLILLGTEPLPALNHSQTKPTAEGKA